jgi:hypothetical protein
MSQSKEREPITAEELDRWEKVSRISQGLSGGPDRELRLIAEVRELRKDRDRLDWLDSNMDVRYEGGRLMFHIDAFLRGPQPFRDAIDAAMREDVPLECECGDPRRHHGHCGCCGEPTDQTAEWCTGCAEHVLKAGYPWDRTWFAQYGVDCPLTSKEYRMHEKEK